MTLSQSLTLFAFCLLGAAIVVRFAVRLLLEQF